MTFTEHFVFRVAFIANNFDFEPEDYLDSKNVHYLISLYSGSFIVVVINKYIKEIQVRFTVTYTNATRGWALDRVGLHN